jgi:RND superfamily putative drug exporter
VPAVIVLESRGAISPGELGELASLKAGLEGLELGSAVIGPIPSEDGKAVQFIAPIGSSGELKESVQELRNFLAESAPEGMQTFVTGPAGLTADLVSAFAGIDGILLLVALGAVFLILLVVSCPSPCCSPRSLRCVPPFCWCSAWPSSAGSS